MRVRRAIPRVVGDEARLGQVFIALLINAAQSIAADHDDARDNEIRIQTSTDAAGCAVIEVRDTGTGISGDVMERIFDPFFSTRAIGGGTGLGLSIAHNIIAAMGGAITVASQERGTAFRVVLPPADHARAIT
ncbi:MAG: ATP-binding protein [Myxococcota bacterium]|nr:ATP-binding protein [Myxococcota bacterium]